MKRLMMAKHGQRAVRPTQQGAAMIISMVLLTVIGMASAAVMRNALNADQLANNLRAQSLAAQYAEVGLRYCERQMLSKTGLVPLQNEPASGFLWQTFANWFGGARIATSIPAGTLTSANSSFTLAKAPECLAEKDTLISDGTQVIIVTARGFSPDYTEDSNGRGLTGAAVWVQSIIRLADLPV